MTKYLSATLGSRFLLCMGWFTLNCPRHTILKPMISLRLLTVYLDNYLCYFVSFQPLQWVRWLSFAEFWHNTNINSSTGFSPFEVLHGIKPSRLLSYVHDISALEEVDCLLSTRDPVIKLLKENLKLSQNRMNRLAIPNVLSASLLWVICCTFACSHTKRVLSSLDGLLNYLHVI